MRKYLVKSALFASCALILTGCNGASSSFSQSTTEPEVSQDAKGLTMTATPTPTTTPVKPGKGPECKGVRCVSVMTTGDVLLHEGLWEQAQEDAAVTGNQPRDFYPLIEGQKNYTNAADLSICHMETPIGTADGTFSAYPTFNVPPEIMPALKKVGYQACDSASNHSFDVGTDGINRTIDGFNSAGLQHTGSYKTEADSKKPLIIQTPTAKIGLVVGTYGLNGLEADYPWQVDLLDANTMIAKAKAARAQGADLVIAAMHAGDEYSNTPNQQQTDLAHALIDSGQFDYVYGHHTHSVLPIEQYKGKWIVYGLGNAETEHDPNNDVAMMGLLTRIQFSEDKNGKWTSSELAYAPSTIGWNSFPYRWCSLATDKPQGTCTDDATDQNLRQQVVTTVNSMGADKAGLKELLVKK
ncbi:MAG: CapA family protein [Micrococcaceae bacterium]